MEQRTMTYQEAFDGGIVKEGDYFSVQYPDGRNVLFRLVKREKGYFMWGMETTKEILLKGKNGYDKFLTLANAELRKKYSSKDVFGEVHAVGLDEPDYEVHSLKEFNRLLDEARKICGNPEDTNMYYALASRCVSIYSGDESFRVFSVNSGSVDANYLWHSYGGAGSPIYAVRPEATPKSTLLLKIDGCDGSKENPWICLNNQEDIQEVNPQNDSTAGEVIAEVSKRELMKLIQEGYALIQKESEWIAKLEKYAQKLR